MSTEEHNDRFKIDDASPTAKAANKLRFDVEEITPSLATQMLEKAETARADSKAIATYAQTMENGAWILNGQPIIFDEAGRVIDGIQRLSACIKANTPFKTIVARGVRADTLHTIDQHRRRSYPGILESRGIREAGKVQRTMSKLIRIENGSLGRENPPISYSRYDRVLDANPEILEARDISERVRGTRLHSTARPVLIYMALRAGHERELMSFLRELGPNRTSGLNSPPGMFSMQASILEQNDKGLNVDHILALAILAFNDHLEGKKVNQNYMWKKDYGTTPLNDAGLPVSRAALLDGAPANLGLPIMTGYPGLREGSYDTFSQTDEFGGRTDEQVKRGAENDKGAEQVRMMTVTPAMARDWLQFNSGNREIQKNHIATIKRDILKSNWMMNAQPICFTDNPLQVGGRGAPRLLNGQHRLHAIIEANTAIDVPIATGIPRQAFATFDTHAKRTVRRAGNRVDDRVLAAAAKLQWKQDNDLPLTGSGNSPSATEILKTLNDHPDLPAGFARARRSGMTELGSAGVMTYFIYRVLHEHSLWGAEFLDGIEYGANLDRGNPILNLRNLARGRRKSLSRSETLTILIEHWEAFKDWKIKKNNDTQSGHLKLV